LYVDPQTSQDWQDVALERSSDAATLHAGQRSVGTLYFLGFVAEGYAKALCVANGRPVPRGSDGHDIIAILNSAGVGRAVLSSTVRRFVEKRDVGLRYQVASPAGVDLSTELAWAKRFIQWCETRLNRLTQRQTRRRR
jgi:hypothetical protein